MNLYVLFSVILVVCSENISDNDSGPNSQYGDNLGHTYKFHSTVLNREDLNIRNVKSDDFKYGQGVVEWKSINTRNESFLVGRKANGITVLKVSIGRNGFDVEEVHTECSRSQNITAFNVFKMWNNKSNIVDKYVVVSTHGESGSELIFCRIASATGLVPHQWKVPGKITFVTIFRHSKSYKLLIVYERENSAAIRLCDVSLDATGLDIRSDLTLPLNNSVSEVAVSSSGTGVYVSVPQERLGVVRIFKVSKEFVLHEEMVGMIARDFTVGVNAHVAIGGPNFTVYTFMKTGLRKVYSTSMSNITCIQAVRTRTYRDEPVLLVQHEHETISAVTYTKDDIAVYNVSSVFGPSVGCTKGSAFLSLKGRFGLVVPRFGMHSRLFMFDTSFASIKNSTLERLKKIQYFKTTVDEQIFRQSEIINEIERRASQRDGFSSRSRRQNDEQEVNKLIQEIKDKLSQITNEFQSVEENINRVASGNFSGIESLTVLDHIEVRGTTFFDSVTLNTINNNDFNDTVANTARWDTTNEITARKIFTNVNLDNMDTAGMDIVDLSTNNTMSVRINGHLTASQLLTVEEDLTVSDRVNNFNLSEDIVVNNRNIRNSANIHFESLNVGQLRGVKSINGVFLRNMSQEKALHSLFNQDVLDFSDIDLTVDKLNGVPFSMERDICLQNQSCIVNTTTTIKGNLIARNCTVKILNGLKFPDEYLVKGQASFANITGKKTFQGNLVASEVVVNEFVSNINPNFLITLSTDQTIPRNFTFANLEVTESIMVEGSIITPDGEEVFKNPTLLEQNQINADVNFNSIEIDGTLTILNSLNRVSLEKIFGDVIYKDDTDAVVNSFKEISVLKVGDVVVESGEVSGIPLSSILTQDTEQEIPHLTTDAVVVHNLQVDGYFDGLNLTELFQSVVMTDEDAHITSKINFVSAELSAPRVSVTKLNGDIDGDSLVVVGDDGELNADVQFDHLRADTLVFENDMNLAISGLDIEFYKAHRLTADGSQNISVPYEVAECDIDTMNITSLNDIFTADMEMLQGVSSVLDHRLSSGRLEITELIVDGSVDLEMMNGMNLNDELANVFRIGQDQNITGELVFETSPTFEKLDAKYLNGLELDHFVNDIVLDDEKSPLIDGYKIFKHGFNVTGHLNTTVINNVRIEDALARADEQNISGNVIVHGNVTVNNLSVGGRLNDVDLRYIAAKMRVEKDRYILQNSVDFSEDTNITNFMVRDYINSKILNEHLKKIVRKNQDYELTGDFVFQNKVHVRNNLGVKTTINNIKLHAVAENIAKSSQDVTINGDVYFTEPVDTKRITVHEDLNATLINGYDLNEMINNSVLITDDLSNLKLVNVTVLKELKVRSINDIQMDDLIPLNTNQTIDSVLEFKFVTVDNDINVNNLVNGLNFRAEYENTLLSSGSQTVEGKVVFSGPVVVNKYLKCDGPVNGKDLRRIVTVNSDQELSARYVFNDKLTLESDLQLSSGLMNGVDVIQWSQKVVTDRGDSVQTIEYPWSVRHVQFNDNVTGGPIGNLHVDSMLRKLEAKEAVKQRIDAQILEDFRNNCTQLRDLVTGRNLPKYLFKYFELRKYSEFNERVRCVHHFKTSDGAFRVLNVENDCESVCHRWVDGDWVETMRADTGEVERFITVHDGTETFLVVQNGRSDLCRQKGLSVWLLGNGLMTPIFTVQEAQTVQQSKLPGTFYTLDSQAVVEYRIFSDDDERTVRPQRQWRLPAGSFRFNPHGMRVGLSVRDGQRVLQLSRTYTEQALSGDGPVLGRVAEYQNEHMPATGHQEIAVLDVGVDHYRRKFIAVTDQEYTSVRGTVDTIKIYENVVQGRVFQRIPAYKPTSLISVPFDNGESLLMFLEDGKSLQMYEYRGIEGFTHRSTAEIEGTVISSVTLPVEPYQKQIQVVCVVNENSLTYLSAVMIGDRLDSDIVCDPSFD